MLLLLVPSPQKSPPGPSAAKVGGKLEGQPRIHLRQGSGDCTGPRDPERRVRITRKTGVARIRPSANFFFGNVFFRRAILDIFFATRIGGLLGLLRLPGRESESIGPVHQIWLGGGLGGPETAPLGQAKKSVKTVLCLNVFFDALPSALWRLLSQKKSSEFPRGGKKAPNTDQSEPTKMSQGLYSSFLGVTSCFSLLSSLCFRHKIVRISQGGQKSPEHSPK